MKRKIRIAAGGFQAIARLGFLWNIFKYGLLSFQYVSHRAMRWAVAPFCLPLLVLINAIILFTGAELLDIFSYHLLMIAQIAFYILALLGYYLENKKLE